MTLGAGDFPPTWYTFPVTSNFCPASFQPALVSTALILAGMPTYMISQPSQPPPTNWLDCAFIWVAAGVVFCPLQPAATVNNEMRYMMENLPFIIHWLGVHV